MLQLRQLTEWAMKAEELQLQFKSDKIVKNSFYTFIVEYILS